MSLKKKVTKAEFDALNETIKALYKQVDGKDEYVLMLADDNSDDLAKQVNEMKEKLAVLEAEKEEAEKKRAEAEAEKEKRKIEKAEKDKDFEAFRKSLEEKYNKEVAEREAKIEALSKNISQSKLDGVALELANEISISPKVMLPHLKGRLAVNEKFEVVVVDSDGRPSALTIDDLKKEFIANSDFSAIIKGATPKGGQTTSGSYTKPEGKDGSFNGETATGTDIWDYYGNR